MPLLQHNPNRPEDVMTDSEDHAADEWRYACMSRPSVPTREPVNHTYGRHIKYTGRSEFDPVRNLEKPFLVKVAADEFARG